MESTRELAKKIAHLLDSKKAMDISLLDVQGISSITDYFIIASGTSTRHVLALTGSVEERAKTLQMMLRHKEGHRTGDWVILDYADLVVHVFVRETRDYYGLDRMWQDARHLELSLDTGAKAL